MKTKLLLLILSVSLSGLFNAQETYIYESDAANFTSGDWQIMRYDIDGSNPQVFIDQELGWPQDIVFLEDQEVVLISNLTTGRITKHDATTGDFIEDFALVAGGPTRMKIGADNLLYVLHWSNTNNKILRYQLDGTFEDEFTDIGVVQSIGLDWDSEGNLYVSSYGGGSVTKFDSDGNSQGLFVDSELAGPTNIWFGTDGHLFVLDWSGANAEEFDENGVYVGTFITGLSQPEGIAIMENGNLLIGNGGPREIKQYQNDGTFVENTVESGSGGLDQPNAVVLREAILSIEDQPILKNFVTPTMGNLFHIIQNDIYDFKSLEVFSITGTLVAQLENTATTWNAEHQAEGLYFLVAITQTGTKAVQKIAVNINY